MTDGAPLSMTGRVVVGGAAAGSFGPKNSTDYINISQAVLRLLGHK